MKNPNKREATERIINKNLPTSRQDLPNFLTQNLIKKKAVTGIVMMNNSANERGRILVTVAIIPLKIVEIYLLKKSAKAVLDIEMIYKIMDKTENPKKK